METYFDTSSLPFAPVVKVKPLVRAWDELFKCWLVRCKVTSRRHGNYGEIRYVRPSELFERSGVQRGKCGRLTHY
jgi:hypothetical protein